jgi:CheY-like chemotaxis protein
MNPTPPKRPVTVLVVEDDEVDLMAIQRGFKQHKVANELVCAKDGVEALQILRGEDGRAALAAPYIILLDLNMPRMNGFEFLQTIRQDAALRTAIVFVLTTSKSDEDRAKAYSANVAGFIVKADAGRGFLGAVEMLDHYWRVVELP